MAVQIKIVDNSFEMMSTIALTYVVNHWDKFVKEMGLAKGPDGEDGVRHMHDEICHYTARMLYHNDEVLALIINMWGEEKVHEFVNKLTNHSHD